MIHPLAILSFAALLASYGPLEEHKWKNRIVIIFAEDRNADFYVQQVEKLNENSAQFRERDLLSFHIFKNAGFGPDSQPLSKSDRLYLENHYNISQGGFKLLLIGKDGTVKLDSSVPVDAKDIYALIDSMPMRQIEMQRRNSTP